MPSDNEHRDEVFTELVMAHQDRLFGYVYASVQNTADAEDLVQRTVLSLWNRFDDFERGTNFAAWALTTARHEVLNYRRRSNRQMLFTADLISRLADSAAATSEDDDTERRQALRACVGELSNGDRQSLDARYQDNQSLKQIAERLARSEQSVSRSLGRIRKQLFDCISRKLSQETHR